MKKVTMIHIILMIQWMLQPEFCFLSLTKMATGIYILIFPKLFYFLAVNMVVSMLFWGFDFNLCRYLSDIELLPIIGKLHPSGHHYYAKKQAEYLISQVLHLML